jgi:aspartate/methionine/tyrosine aminotransferase
MPNVTCSLPKGAFYAFANIKHTGLTSRDFQNRLLEEEGVASVAGTSFGIDGEGYLRFSYANSIENIETAMDRMDQFVQKLGAPND